LAPLQFLAFVVSVVLIMRTLVVGDHATAAAVSVVVKTFLLLAIMVTGAIWEKDVFGQYLFAPAFYWEDVFSMLVIALHVAYVVALAASIGDVREQLILALCGYAAYAVNATQFVLKLRAARRQERALVAVAPGGAA
jgi:3-vinyl bacteriochlorophyllide hydratase